MKRSIIILLMSLCFAAGCAHYTYYPQTGGSLHPESDPEMIGIYSGDIDQMYEVIASVAADVPGDGESAAKYLKRKAARLGADAIIHVELTKISSQSQRTVISGVAVRMTEEIRDKSGNL